MQSSVFVSEVSESPLSSEPTLFNRRLGRRRLVTVGVAHCLRRRRRRRRRSSCESGAFAFSVLLSWCAKKRSEKKRPWKETPTLLLCLPYFPIQIASSVEWRIFWSTLLTLD